MNTLYINVLRLHIHILLLYLHFPKSKHRYNILYVFSTLFPHSFHNISIIHFIPTLFPLFFSVLGASYQELCLGRSGIWEKDQGEYTEVN